MGIKTCRKRKTSIFIVNKRLKEAKAKFLIEHDKKNFEWCIITLYIEESPGTDISDTPNELNKILVHNCFYILGKAKTYIKFTPTKGVLGAGVHSISQSY